jgi:hypothetical protein
MRANPTNELLRFSACLGRPLTHFQSDASQNLVIHLAGIGLGAAMLNMTLRASNDAGVKCCGLTLKQSSLARVTAETLVVNGALVRGVTRLAIRLEWRMRRRQRPWIRMALPVSLLPMAGV